MQEKELLDLGYRKYAGEKIDVYFNADQCHHSGICVKGLPTVFNVNEKPWINLETCDVEAVKKVIDRCPSGGLKYMIKEN